MSFCKALNVLLVNLREMELRGREINEDRARIVNELFDTIINAAQMFCGRGTSWNNLKVFLRDGCNVEIPRDVDTLMSQYESLADVILPDDRN